jgi:hypothetical protein
VQTQWERYAYRTQEDDKLPVDEKAKDGVFAKGGDDICDNVGYRVACDAKLVLVQGAGDGTYIITLNAHILYFISS